MNTILLAVIVALIGAIGTIFSTVIVAKINKVHTLVNSRQETQDLLILNLQSSIRQLMKQSGIDDALLGRTNEQLTRKSGVDDALLHRVSSEDDPANLKIAHPNDS